MEKMTLEQRAVEAMKNSYSPYSQKTVGAALLSKSGKIFTGCNIENSSFGGTVCAERVAIWKAVSEEGPHFQWTQIAVATEANPPWCPCGLCLQVLNEFKSENSSVSLTNPSGTVLIHTFKNLLPLGFDRSSLGK